MAFNATPMVDVFFLLSIFFMLVTHFSSAEQVPMQVPQPVGSRAEVTHLPDRIVINCRTAPGRDDDTGGVLYSIGPNPPESLASISDRLAQLKLQSPHIKVVVRADKRLPYVDVRAVMRVIAAEGIEMLHIVAHVSDDE